MGVKKPLTLKTEKLFQIYLRVKKFKVEYPPSRKCYNAHLYG